MSALSVWDHLFAAVVFVAYPTFSRLTIKSTLRSIAEGGERARLGAYKEIILVWIGFGLCALALWFWFDRPWPELGIVGTPAPKLIIGACVAAIAIAAFVLPIRAIARQPVEGIENFNSQLGDTAILMPKTCKEEAWFYGVSLNAGIIEELVFRAYLLWYLQHFIGLICAAVLAVIAFAIAHAYQGVKLLPGILLVSAIAMGLYVYTGSLLVPIVFHILLDALQGRYVARTHRAAMADV